MNEGIVTKRYAKALFMAGEEEGKTEEIRKDIDSILLTVKESDEFKEFLDSPIIKQTSKAKLLRDIFEGKLNSITLTFLELLAKNRREQFLTSACLQYLELYQEYKGIKQAVFTTTKALSEAHRKEVLEYLKKEFKLKVELVENIDETIIGGFKLRIEDKQIDASIKAKLRKIETELINS